MDIPKTPVGDVLAAIAADQPSPGAGAAAGVALGLACACLAKALRISGRRADDGELSVAAMRAEALAERATLGAQQDCEDFPAALKFPTDPATQARLQADGLDALAACRDLRGLLAAYGDRVSPNLQGDVSAASHLLSAAEQIHARNLEEAAPGENDG